jgi:hypothetical protein
MRSVTLEKRLIAPVPGTFELEGTESCGWPLLAGRLNKAAV